MQPRLTIHNRDIESIRLLWHYLRVDTPLPPVADAIVVGGCHDIAVAERAVSIYKTVRVPTIVMSGYKNPHSKLPISEADYFSDYAESRGVPSSAILRERHAANTGQNITNSAALLPNAKTVILVHKPYMTRRFLATARKQWPRKQPVFFVTSEHIFPEDYFSKVGLADIGVMLGDFARIGTYAERGYQMPQEIPTDVLDAYHKLVRRGYKIRDV